MEAGRTRYGAIPAEEGGTASADSGWSPPWHNWRGFLSRFARAIVLGAAILAILCAVIVMTVKALMASWTVETKQPSYDFIIVGAGPAGSVLARKLSDEAGVSVLLLEAGGRTQYDLGGQATIAGAPITPFDVPLLWPSIAAMEDYRWNDLNLEGVMAAKALGGCGIHNAMLYVRAIPADFEEWNLTSWDWATALKTYKQLEDWIGDDASYHGKGGPIRTRHVAPPLYVDPVSPIFIDSAVQTGIVFTDDFNDPNNRQGVGYYHFNIRGGIRESAARAMLAPVLGQRSNLRLELGATVKRVLFDTNDKGTPAAIGVEYEQGGKLNTAYLIHRKKSVVSTPSVVISAGAIMTPRLLMASGIGPKAETSRLGVEAVVDNRNVGSNLQDHPAVGVIIEMNPALVGTMPSTFDVATQFTAYVTATQRFRQTGELDKDSTGIFASAGLTAGAFVVSPYATNRVPDIQLTVFPRVTEPHIASSHPANMSTTTQFLVTVALLKPDARHKMVVNDKMQFEIRQQTPGYLSAKDVKRLAWGVDLVREIKSLGALGSLTGAEVQPGADVRDKDLEQWVREHFTYNSHWCGTAAMGDDPATSVVDTQLRVRGVDNLRVADASVIPKIPNGNVHSTVVMIASRAADMLLQN